MARPKGPVPKRHNLTLSAGTAAKLTEIKEVLQASSDVEVVRASILLLWRVAVKGGGTCTITDKGGKQTDIELLF